MGGYYTGVSREIKEVMGQSMADPRIKNKGLEDDAVISLACLS